MGGGAGYTAHLRGPADAPAHQHPAAVPLCHPQLPLRQSAAADEFINKTVAELLEKLLIEQTKSRPRKSGDNGLVETKNAAIVRKHIGWGHIAPAHAAPINQFYTGFLNPYVNYHRPSAQAEVQIDAKGDSALSAYAKII